MSKRQVVVIHGGDSFATYEEYLEFLKDFQVSLETSRGWKGGLAEALGDTYEVILPRMPNAFNAKYAEWKLWFEKYLSLLDEEVILVGHSLGGVFLARYLATSRVSRKIRGTLLVAAPFGDTEGTGEFAITGSLGLFAEQGGHIYLYQSTDDPIVPAEEVEKYRAALPHATVRMFSDRGHFLGEEFPEIVEDITSLG